MNASGKSSPRPGSDEYPVGLSRIRRLLTCPTQDLDITSLENCPAVPTKLHAFKASRTSCSDLSRLHLNEDAFGSESVVSFDSISTKSEVAFNAQHRSVPVQPAPDSEAHHSQSVDSPPCASTRRGSCPSMIESNHDISQDEPVCHPPRRVLSMSHLELQDKSASALSVAERRERLKASLSRLSKSVVSVAESVNSAKKVDKSKDPEISDILSPISSIAKVEDNAPSPLRVQKPPPGPSSGHISDLGGKPVQTLNNQFVPSAIGRHLMSIYGNDKPQEHMWSSFVAKAKDPIEFADSANRMPSVVFCLRGLIRFGNGDYGAGRTDTLPHLINILLKRHPISETSSSIEAAECSAAVLSMLAINPVSRQMNHLQHRARFEPVMTTQNGFLFQQIIAFLSNALPKYLQVERARDPAVPLMTRATCSVLDIAFVYSTTPVLRNSWLVNAPPPFKQTVALTVSGLGERIPSVVNRCMCILDALLDHMNTDTNTCKQIAETLRTVVSHAPTPQIANETIQVVRKWGQPSLQSVGSARKRNSSIGSFFRSLGGKRSSDNQTVSIKSTIFAEYNHS